MPPTTREFCEVNVKRYRLFWIVSLLLMAWTVPAAAQSETPFKVIGYYTYYSIYDAQYFVTDIPAERLTHLYYGPFDVTENGQCASADAWADTGYKYPGDRDNERLRGNIKQLRVLDAEHPDLSIMMTVGGWDFSANLHAAAADARARERFAKSCVAFMREYEFEGIDIDWRYPVVGGKLPEVATPEDAQNYVLLLQALREQLDIAGEDDGRVYSLTATTPGVPAFYESLLLDEMQPYVDWFNVFTVGYEGEWSALAAPAAPLFGSPRDPRGDEVRATQNVEGTINAYLNAGVFSEKLVMTVPFYAQAWRNVRPNDYFGLYQTTEGVPNGTRAGGTLYYSDLESFLTSDDYVRFFDNETRSAWMYNEGRRIAISYENAESLMHKSRYVIQQRLGGIMAYELAYDDRTHTLLTAIADYLAPTETE